MFVVIVSSLFLVAATAYHSRMKNQVKRSLVGWLGFKLVHLYTFKVFMFPFARIFIFNVFFFYTFNFIYKYIYTTYIHLCQTDSWGFSQHIHLSQSLDKNVFEGFSIIFQS